MRHASTRPLMRRMQTIDQALRARKWPTDETLAGDLEVDPRTIRRDLEFMRDGHHTPIAFDQSRIAGTAPVGRDRDGSQFRERRVLIFSAFEPNAVVDPKLFTEESLELPDGTRIVDQQVGRKTSDRTYRKNR
jgi:hypothetical protein